MASKPPVTAFDKGQAAAREEHYVENPFEEGSPEHNNFEVGRRFAAQKLRGAALVRSPEKEPA